MPGTGTGPRPGGWETLHYSDPTLPLDAYQLFGDK